MTDSPTMTPPDAVKVFNEWMRRFIEEPERFSREFQDVTEFLADEATGAEPSYGQACAEYQFRLLDEMNAAPAP